MKTNTKWKKNEKSKDKKEKSKKQNNKATDPNISSPLPPSLLQTHNRLSRRPTKPFVYTKLGVRIMQNDKFFVWFVVICPSNSPGLSFSQVKCIIKIDHNKLIGKNPSPWKRH